MRNFAEGGDGFDRTPALGVLFVFGFAARVLISKGVTIFPVPSVLFEAFLRLFARTAKPCRRFAVSSRNLAWVVLGFRVFEVTVGVFSFAIYHEVACISDRAPGELCTS